MQPFSFLTEDISLKLIEWLELLRLQGFHKVFIYELNAHPNITKVVFLLFYR